MITTFDDYPVHQTAEPVAVPASGDRNHYDRHFFNGYDRAGGFFFAVALGLHPNRQAVDASFSVPHDGVQRSVHASGRAPVGHRSRAGSPAAAPSWTPAEPRTPATGPGACGTWASRRGGHRAPARAAA